MATAAEAVFEDLVLPTGEFSGDTESGATPDSEEPGSDEAELAEEKAQKCSIALDRAENDRERLGLELGRALIELRDKVKHGQWAIKLAQLGISEEKARYWMTKAEGGNPNRHKKEEQAEPSKAETPEAEAEPKKAFTSWEALSRELNALAGYAYILKNSQPVSESFITELTKLAERMGFKIEPRGEQ